MSKKQKSKKSGGKCQKAILVTIPSASSPGSSLDELNCYLADGWVITDTAPLCAHGDKNTALAAIVVIKGREPKAAPPKKVKEPKAPKAPKNPKAPKAEKPVAEKPKADKAKKK